MGGHGINIHLLISADEGQAPIESQRQRGADAPRRYGEYCDWLRETLGAIDRIGYCHDRTAALLLLSSPKGHRT